MELTPAQFERLKILGCDVDPHEDFETVDERDRRFKSLERTATGANREALRSMQTQCAPVLVNDVIGDLSSHLRGRGFMEVSTPIILSKQFLERMTIDDSHSLHDQVFWLDGRSCLRPMLAPGLYDISKRLLGILGKPLSVFEIGPCFRRESLGARHLENFTMCNFVEWGIEEEGKVERLKGHVDDMMTHLGLAYELEEEDSTVYGTTIDVIVDGLEVASGAFGPHPLDEAWGYEGSWLGLGIGVERIVCLMHGMPSVQKVGRSFTYHNGISLAFK